MPWLLWCGEMQALSSSTLVDTAAEPPTALDSLPLHRRCVFAIVPPFANPIPPLLHRLFCEDVAKDVK